jgi:putative copper export protein
LVPRERYERLLIVKLGLFDAMYGLAALNRFVRTAVERGNRDASRHSPSAPQHIHRIGVERRRPSCCRQPWTI